MKQNTQKTIFITAGDPLGIGPEIVVKALKNPRVQRACHAVVIGEETSLKNCGWTDNLGELMPLYAPRLPKMHIPSKVSGQVSFQAVETGIKLALKTGCPLVTAPISKRSWQLADIPFTGHTELLRLRTQTNGLMMFISGSLRVALVTEHFALAHLPLTIYRIENCTERFLATLKKQGIKNPKIALCAFNPHAGENGLFGTEEKKVLIPAIKKLKLKGITLNGPFPADTAWLKHVRGEYDGLVCIYHDQALLGLKLAAKEPIVHITAGLPFMRTSPTHGTAFDIAGQNKADESSMVEAILFAAKEF